MPCKDNYNAMQYQVNTKFDIKITTKTKQNEYQENTYKSNTNKIRGNTLLRSTMLQCKDNMLQSELIQFHSMYSIQSAAMCVLLLYIRTGCICIVFAYFIIVLYLCDVFCLFFALSFVLSLYRLLLAGRQSRCD